jgi:hypothetical protein
MNLIQLVDVLADSVVLSCSHPQPAFPQEVGQTRQDVAAAAHSEEDPPQLAQGEGCQGRSQTRCWRFET